MTGKGSRWGADEKKKPRSNAGQGSKLKGQNELGATTIKWEYHPRILNFTPGYGGNEQVLYLICSDSGGSNKAIEITDPVAISHYSLYFESLGL